MESFCPLCAKSGIKKRVKPFQINLEEAVWACESEECSWPLGYEELTFFARTATSYNWEEPSPAKEDMPALMELSLYTPPVTPRGEFSKELTEIASTEYSSNPPMEDKVGTLSKCEYIASTKESIGSNKSPQFESLELGNINSAEENKSIMNEQITGIRTLPKIINIEETNINLKIFSHIDEHCDNNRVQEPLLMDATMMDTFKNLYVFDSACTAFDSSTQHKTEQQIGSEQNESDKLQLDTTMNDMETNFGAETLSETMKTLVDLDVTNNLNTTNESVANISNGDIDTLLENIFNSESHISININDDWLNLLIS